MTETSLPPLHTQDPLGRFSNRAADYAQYRPSYPAEAIAQVLSGWEHPETLIIADIGAGTGISSRLFADQGAMVLAIEPNETMRQAATPHQRVEFRNATAEQTGLPDRSVDLVTCCQSFHWFEPTATLAEFHRILKPTGRVALMWNDRDLTDEVTQAYSDIVRAASDQQTFDRRDRKSADALATSSIFTNFRQDHFTYRHPLDAAGLIGLAASSSYVAKSGQAYEQMKLDLQKLFEQRRDRSEAFIYLVYRTDVYLADPVS
jgi:SAM-dependent methyltransferase